MSLIGDALQERYDVGLFLHSSKELDSKASLDRAIGALKAIRNWEALRDLKQRHLDYAYDYWLIHNVFPAMSPAVYTLAEELRIPVIQYLHNYRMGCVNGLFLNHGEPCQRCMHGNFMPAFQTFCWHESRLMSGMMGGIMAASRKGGILDSPTAWVAISEAQKREHVLMGIAEEKIAVIPHFLEFSQNPPSYAREGDVLYVGRLSTEKGVDRLLKAWEGVQDLGRHLWIVGDGPERGALEAMVRAMALRNVHFTGFLSHEDQSAIWAKSAFSVVPSIWKEPFGMVVLEAWAKGRPVIAHRIGGIPEIITEGKEGLLVKPDDSLAMAQAMRRLMDHPEEAEAMGRAGTEKLRSEFNKNMWLEKFTRLIEASIAKGKRFA